MNGPDLKTQLSALFAETGKAHHQAYLATDGYDIEWPQWYAAYLQPRLGELLNRSFTVAELVNLVLLLEAGSTANPSDRPWPSVYADLLVAHLSGGDAADKA